MKFELAITKMFALLLPAGAWIKKLISSPALLKLTIKFAGTLWTLVKWGNVKINCVTHKHITVTPAAEWNLLIQSPPH